MTSWALATARPRPERGSVTPLLIVFAVSLALMIAAVTDVSAAYLRRQAAASLADGAALSASDAAAAASVYASGESRRFVPIDEDAARHAVLAYLDDTGAFRRYPGLQAAVQVVDGRTVVVDLAMPYDLPISIPGARDSVLIRVQAAAELPVY
jgi:Putative Flp pilus-assembly TadE/G-like